MKGSHTDMNKDTEEIMQLNWDVSIVIFFCFLEFANIFVTNCVEFPWDHFAISVPLRHLLCDEVWVLFEFLICLIQSDVKSGWKCSNESRPAYQCVSLRKSILPTYCNLLFRKMCANAFMGYVLFESLHQLITEISKTDIFYMKRSLVVNLSHRFLFYVSIMCEYLSGQQQLTHYELCSSGNGCTVKENVPRALKLDSVLERKALKSS